MSQFDDNPHGLPDLCYAVHPSRKVGVLVKRGTVGYFELDFELDAKHVPEMNRQLGVTPEQAEAMLMGSMRGFDVPGANPALHKRKAS